MWLCAAALTTQLLVTPSATSGQLVDPKAVHRVHNPEDIVALAQFVQVAVVCAYVGLMAVQSSDSFTKATVGGKLGLICDQIRHLQAQAQQVSRRGCACASCSCCVRGRAASPPCPVVVSYGLCVNSKGEERRERESGS